MFKLQLCAATVFTSLLTLPALAAPVNVGFSSDGSFSNISNYSGNPSASISNDKNVLDMGGGNNSTLTANDFMYSGSTPLNDVVLGKLTWINRVSTNTDPTFNVSYGLVLTFTSPNADVASQNFSLTIQQPVNPPGDTVSGLTISGLPSTFNLNGVTVSDFKFSVESGNGLGGTFTNGSWYNPDPTGYWGDNSRTSVLLLTADFKQDPTAVPEPGTIAILGAGLLALGSIRQKKL